MNLAKEKFLSIKYPYYTHKHLYNRVFRLLGLRSREERKTAQKNPFLIVWGGLFVCLFVVCLFVFYSYKALEICHLKRQHTMEVHAETSHVTDSVRHCNVTHYTCLKRFIHARIQDGFFCFSSENKDFQFSTPLFFYVKLEAMLQWDLKMQ